MQKASKTMSTKFQKKSSAKETGFAPAYGVVSDFSVKNVKAFDWGTVFTLVLNGVEIHGCKVAEARDGNSFISMPSYKGKDGKYYSHVYFRFSEKDTDAILKEVAEAIE